MASDPSVSFQCPLRVVCGKPFSSLRAVNGAVSRYKSCRPAAARRHQAGRLYLRHLPLVRKTLARFCPRSRCYPGGCLPEELVGETYPIFLQALEDFEPAVGVDFVGFFSQRLHWRLQHRARRLCRLHHRAPPPQLMEEPAQQHDEEDRVLDRVMAHELLAHLAASDALLMARYAAGHTSAELAESLGISTAAVRKRLERLRARLRTLASAG